MSGAFITIRHNATGEVRRYRDDHFDPNPESASEFLWTEGNYACDCNRAILFARAGSEDDDPERTCGHKMFHVIEAVCDDGTVVELDGEDSEN